MIGEDLPTFGSFSGGRSHAGAGLGLDLRHPATGDVWGRAFASVDIASAAVVTAKVAFDAKVWSGLDQPTRSDILRRVADTVEARGADFTRFETLATGKTVSATKDEGADLARWLRFYAGVAEAATGRAIELSRTVTAEERTEPVGVVAAITPFNGALSLGSWKVAPALAIGNSVVLKPPLGAPASSLLWAELAAEAGIPAGVFNVVPGEADVGSALVEHPDVSLVTFTGSTRVAMELASKAGLQLKRFLCEAGGKSAHIVFGDADLGMAVDSVARGIFGNAGQSCVAGSRLLVHASIAEEVVGRLVERARALRLGDPFDPTTEMGPLASAHQLNRVTEMVDRAKAGYARCLIGGRPAVLAAKFRSGFFFEPTVLTEVDPASEIWNEEVFGPVLAVRTFETDDEAVTIANASKYGLAAGLWTSRLDRAHEVSHALQAGTVWVNTYRYFDHRISFGGFKQSGIGRENGAAVLRDFANVKSIITDYQAPSPAHLIERAK